MSLPLSNPHGTGIQSSSQGINKFCCGQTERDPRWTVPLLGPESSFSSPGTPSGTPAMSGGQVTAQLSLSMGIRPEIVGTNLNKNFNNVYVKEELKHQPVGHQSSMPNNQRDILPTSTTQGSTYSVSSASQEHFQARIASILTNYGLDQDDLDELINSPDELTTAENLPHTLHNIYLKKAMKAAPSFQPNPNSTTQPTTSMSELNRAIGFKQPGMCQGEMPTTCLQPSKLTDHGPSVNNVTKAEDKISKSICSAAKIGESMLQSDSFKSNIHSKKVPQAGLAELKSSGLVSSNDQLGPVSSLPLMKNIVAPLNNDPAELQSTPNQTLQTTFATLSLPNKAQDKTVPKSEDLTHVPSQEPVPDSVPLEESVCQFAAKTSSTSSVDQDVNAGQSVLVQTNSNDGSFANGQRETQGSKVVGKIIQQTQRSAEKRSELHMLQSIISPAKPVPPSSFTPSVTTASHLVLSFASVFNDPDSCNIPPSQPVLDLANSTCVPHSKQPSPATNSTSKGFPSLDVMHAYSAAPQRTFSHTCSLTVTNASHLVLSSASMRNDSNSCNYPASQPVLDLANTTRVPCLKQRSSAKNTTCKGLPSLDVMRDYAAASPRMFAHTCSLCKKKCAQMKDWLFHQNSSLHLENCKRLREKYPEWDGKLPVLESPSVKSASTSPSASAQPTHRRRQRTSRSRSSSDSPTQSSSRHKKDKSSSRSRSRSYSPYRRNSRKRRIKSRSSSRSSSYSPRHGRSKYTGRRNRSSSSSSSSSRSRRSRPRSYSPWRNRSTSSCYGSRSNSHDRRISPKRKCKRIHSPRKSPERRLSQRRSKEQQWSPRRSAEQQRRSLDHRRSPRRDWKRVSPRGSRERHSSPTRSRERHLSPRRSRERHLSPRRSRERHSSPRRSRERHLSPRRSRERYSSPRRSRERHSSPGSDKRWSISKNREQRWQSMRSGERHSSPRRRDDRSGSPTRSPERQSSSSARSGKRTTDDKQKSPASSSKQHLTTKGDNEKHPLLIKTNKKILSAIKICKRRASQEESSSQKKKSCRVQRLTKQVLENPVLQPLANQPNMKEMVELMLPVMMAEVAKERAASSSLTSKSQKKKASTSARIGPSCSSSKVTKVKSKLPKSEMISFTKLKFAKPSPPTMVKLKGPLDSLCRDDVVAAVKVFGKTKSVLLMKLKQEVTVCFERKEDAEKLRNAKSLDVNGVVLSVLSKKGSVSERALPTSTGDKNQPFQQKSAAISKTDSAHNLVLLPIKTLISLPKKEKTTSADKVTKKASVSTSKGKVVSKQEKGNASAKRAVRPVKGEKALKPLGAKKCTSSGESPGSGHLKPKPATKKINEVSAVGLKKTNPATKKIDNGSAVGLNKTTAFEKYSSLFGAETVKGSRTVICAKTRALKTLKVFRAKEKTTKVSSEPTVPESQTEDSGTFKAKNLPPKVEEPAADPEDSAKEMRVITESEEKLQIEIQVDTETTENKAETPEVKKMAAAEPEEVKCSAEDGGGNTTAAQALSAETPISPTPTGDDVIQPEESTQPPETRQTTAETPVDEPPQVQPSPMQSPDPTAQKPEAEAKTGDSSAEAASEAAQSDGHVESKTNVKDSATAETCNNPVLEPVDDVMAAGTPNTKPGTTAKTETPPNHTPAACTTLTIGERIHWYCQPYIFDCIPATSILSCEPLRPDLLLLLLITNLPVASVGYTETDLANLLSMFGFKYEHDNIFVIPQSRMAFILMPNQLLVLDIIRASVHNRLILNDRQLLLHIVRKRVLMSPLGFYKSLMKLTPFFDSGRVSDPIRTNGFMNVNGDGTSLIYIRDICPTEIAELKKALGKIGLVRNFLPLLNKVFIEFESIYDADRLGVWYSFLKKGVFHIVVRMKLPRSCKRAKPPQLPLNALPDSKDVIPGSTIPNAKYGIPQGTSPPFWITMTTNPYVFPTASPWFNIPDFLTIQKKSDITTTLHPGSVYSTVMLTGLPEGNYKHEDVAKLLWPYFPQHNLQTLYYNILVLPLQRRAFVYFFSREACCSFVRDHVKKPFSVGGCSLQVHFVLQDIRHKPSEEIMYRTLMTWSNSFVPSLEFLEKRLLCVELSETSLDLISRVMKEVASMACFVNFLSLANRVCIEMIESSCVQNVLEEISLRQDLSTHKTWSKVRHIESLKRLKRRLKDSSEVTINFEGDMSGVSAKPPVVQSETPLQLSEPSNNEEPGARKPAASDESSTVKSRVKPEERAAEPPVLKLEAVSEEGDTEASKVSKCQNTSEEKATEPFIVCKVEIKTEERASDPHIVSFEPPNCSKSGVRPEERATTSLHVSGSEIKPSTKPPVVSGSNIKPTTKPPDASKSEIKTTTKPHNGSTSEMKSTTKPPDTSKSEIKMTIKPPSGSTSEIKSTTKPPDTSKSEIKMTIKPPSGSTSEIKSTTKPPDASKSEIKTTTKPHNGSTSEMKSTTKPPDTSKSEIKMTIKPPSGSTSEIKSNTKPPDASKSEIKPSIKPPVVSGSNIKSTTKPSDASKSEIKLTTKPPNGSMSEMKSTATEIKPATKHASCSMSEMKSTTKPPDASKSEIKTTTKPPSGSTSEIKSTTKPPDASKSEIKTTTKPLSGSTSEIKSTTKPPDTSKSEIKMTIKPPSGSTSEIKSTTKPPDASKSEIKPSTKPPVVSGSNIKSTTKPSDASKSEIKLTTKLPNGSMSEMKSTATEIKPATKHASCSMSEMKSTTKPPDASKSEIKTTTKPPSGSTSEIKSTTKPPDASKSEIKTTTKPPNGSTSEMKSTTKPPDTSKSEIKMTIKPPSGSTSEVKSTTKPPDASKSEIKPSTKPPVVSGSNIKSTTKPSDASKSEIKLTTKPPNGSMSEMKSTATEIKPATKHASCSMSEMKSTTKPPDASKSEIKTTTKPPSGSTSEIKSTTKPPDASKSEIKTTTKPPNGSTSEMKPMRKPWEVSQSVAKLNETSAECAKTVLTSKPETSLVTPCKPFKETSDTADCLAVIKTQTNSASELFASAKNDPTAVNEIKKVPAAAAAASAVDSSLTVGERMESFLKPHKISCWEYNTITKPTLYSIQPRLLLITNLPKYHDGCYTEEELVELLGNFKYFYDDNTLYVIPQACMAFVLMPPCFRNIWHILDCSRMGLLIFKGYRLCVDIVRHGITMSTFEFYKSIMEVAEYRVAPEDGERVIYIMNISPSEARSLRETLKKIKSVKNYFPLLNKVYIEFETSRDADRLGVWYSLLKRCPAHNIYRMKIPRSTYKAMAPRLAAKALPDLEDLVAGVVAPTTNYGVPKGSTPPFSVTMMTFPFVFPTVSPWFIIPNFLTADATNRVWLSYVATKHSTVMLTGLPEGNYKHEDVASLVWQYLPEQNLQSLYYNVLVLPLQRRAFVFFNNSKSCCRFVEDYVKNPVSFKGNELIVHLVLKDMHPGSCEESMYRSVMQWSNTRVPEPESLPQRLLCVTLAETSVQLLIGIMRAVTKVAPVAGFLPLANRICIEMAESSGVAAVVQKIPCAYKYWSKIRHVESLQSLKQRLQYSSKLTLNFAAVKSEPPLPVDGAAEPEEPQTPNEKLQPTAAETVNAPSRSTASEKQPDTSGKVQESAGVPDDSGEAAQTEKESAETIKVESKEAEPLELMETFVPQSSAETKPLPTNTNDSPTPAPSTGPPQRPETTFKTEETSVKPSPEVQKSPQSSDLPAQEPETTTERSQEQQQPAVHSDLVAQKSPPSKVDDGRLSPSAAGPGPSQPSAAAGGEATLDEATSSAPSVLAPEETTPDFQTIASRINFASMETILSEKFLSTDVSLVISNLPEFNDGCYTDADVAHLLRTFDFEIEIDRVFVTPQYRMAFVLQPDGKQVQQFFRASNGQDLVLKGSKVQVQVACIQYTSFGFYTFLMSITGCQRKIVPSSVVYIKNISSSEATVLKNALRKIGNVINYMPLLNKVFVEFNNPGDADRLGVWYSFLRRHLPHSVHRTGLPEGIKTAEYPSLAPQALPDTANIIARAHVPTATTGVPEGSVAPFWITMTSSPYVFSTACPWFNIPEFNTVSKMEHLTLVKQRMKFPIIMLTGLPTAAYTHSDLAKLVWEYFPEQNLHTLYYNVMILPLQRRAFVCFNSWDDGFRFLQDHIRSPVCLKGCVLSAHFILKNILPRSSEESMYRSLMQLSNIDVPDLKSLEDRLLCMEVSGTNRRLVSTVMVKVASVATFTSFLPLADRVYVEMAESSGVTKVLENLSVCKSSEQSSVWKQVGRVERLKNRKQRLKDMAKIAVKLELDTDDVCTTSTDERSPNKESPGSSCSAAAAVSSAGSKVSEPTTEMEEQRQTESTVDSAIAPETDVETAEEEKDESVSCSSVSSDGQEENFPEMDMEVFNALKAAIFDFKDTQSSMSSNEVSDESRSSSAGATDEDSPQNKALEDPEAVLCSKHDVEPDLNLEDLVNEIGEDMKERGSDYSSTSKQTPREEREGQSSDVSSIKSSPSLITSSVSTSSSSEPSEPQTKPSSSVGDSETSPSFSFSEPVEPLRAKSSSTGQTAAAERTPGQEDEPIEHAVRRSDHKGSAESSAAETDESKVERLSEMDPQQKMQLIHQTLKLETKAGTPKEEEDGKSTKENEDMKDQILDSLSENKDEQRNKEERQTSGPEKDQGGLLVSEGVNEVKDEGSTVKPAQTDRTQTEDRETGKDKETEIISVGDESVLKKQNLRRSSRGAKNTQETTRDKHTITTRTTRGGKTVKDSAERGDGETRRTPESLKDVAPTETAEDSSEAEQKIPKDFQETEEDKEAATSRKRGRPRKTRQTPVLNEQQLELSEPEAKRTRLRSPHVAAGIKLPAFNPQTPLGQEFVSRKWGFYCNLCSVSYLNEGTTEDKHCRSQTHCENVQRYKEHQQLLQKLQKKPTRMSTRNSQKPR